MSPHSHPIINIPLCHEGESGVQGPSLQGEIYLLILQAPIHAEQACIAISWVLSFSGVSPWVSGQSHFCPVCSFGWIQRLRVISDRATKTRADHKTFLKRGNLSGELEGHRGTSNSSISLFHGLLMPPVYLSISLPGKTKISRMQGWTRHFMGNWRHVCC